VAHTLARSAGRQETQIILTADYADETDFQSVLIQICVIGVDILAFFAVPQIGRSPKLAGGRSKPEADQASCFLLARQ
jgi:hypothetical protein